MTAFLLQMDPRTILRHGPLVKAIHQTPEGTSDWHRWVAELHVSIRIDDLTCRSLLKADGSHGDATAHTAIARVQRRRERRRLERLLAETTDPGRPLASLASGCERHARELEASRHYQIAAHMYALAARVVERAGKPERLPVLHLAKARCQQLAGDTDAALQTYSVGLHLATASNDTNATCRLLKSQAFLLEGMGRSPEATESLDLALALAKKAGSSDLLSRAYHHRGHVFHERARRTGDTSALLEAIAAYHAALRSSQDPEHRSRLLVDLERVFADSGLVIDANRILRAVVHVAPTGEIKAVALINSRAQCVNAPAIDEKAFDAHVNAIQNIARIPIRLLAHFHREVAEGAQKLNRTDQFEQHYKRAKTLALRAGLEHLLVELRSVAEGDSPSLRLLSSIPPEVAELATGLTEPVISHFIEHGMTLGEGLQNSPPHLTGKGAASVDSVIKLADRDWTFAIVTAAVGGLLAELAAYIILHDTRHLPFLLTEALALFMLLSR